MEDEEREPINKHALYSYISDAYNFTLSTARESVSGNKLDFVGRLFWERMMSVLNDDKPLPDINAQDVDDIFHQIKEERDRYKGNVWSGTIDSFEVKSDIGKRSDRQNEEFLNGFHADVDRGNTFMLGLEAYATYWPIHFFFNSNPSKAEWGIYISEQGVMRLAAALRKAFNDKYGAPAPDTDYLFEEVAYQVLLRHELEHFKIECFALNAELFLKIPLYAPYLLEVYTRTYYTDSECLEEAISNASVLNSVTINNLFKKLYPPTEERSPIWWQIDIAKTYFDKQPYSYRNYSLNRDEVSEPIDGLYTLKKHLLSDYREAMNLLCNQIVQCTAAPLQPHIPFSAFPPDNFFLRAESLVPIHIVKYLSDDDSFISIPTPSRGEWQKFMRKLGYQPTDRGKGDHQVWRSDLQGWADLTINYKGKELDFNSFKSALKTLNISITEFVRYRQTKLLPPSLTSRLADSRV